MLTQREGDVVVEVHRPEHRAVLEQHAEELADLVELLLGAGGDVGALDDDLAPVGLEQADQALEEHGLAGTGRAEHHADLARGDGQGHVSKDELRAEGLREVVNLDLDTHVVGLPLTRQCMRDTGSLRARADPFLPPLMSNNGPRLARLRGISVEVSRHLSQWTREHLPSSPVVGHDKPGRNDEPGRATRKVARPGVSTQRVVT